MFLISGSMLLGNIDLRFSCFIDFRARLEVVEPYDNINIKQRFHGFEVLHFSDIGTLVLELSMNEITSKAYR